MDQKKWHVFSYNNIDKKHYKEKTMSRNLLSIFSRTESKRNELKKQSKSCLSAQFLGKTAREVGFIKRQFSLKIVKFFESLLCSIGTGGNTKITVQKLFSDYNQRVKRAKDYSTSHFITAWDKMNW